MLALVFSAHDYEKGAREKDLFNNSLGFSGRPFGWAGRRIPRRIFTFHRMGTAPGLECHRSLVFLKCISNMYLGRPTGGSLPPIPGRSSQILDGSRG